METRKIPSESRNLTGNGFQQLSSGTTLLNRYLIQDVVGIGGMGAVYRARDLHFPKLVKLVAVKEVVSQVHDPEARAAMLQNFEREANLLATLNHHSIPRILDYFSQRERSYLVMEFVQGKNLEEVLNENGGPLPVDRVIAWGLELCDVLHYLHSHKPESIIFRDMKPSNVMYNQHGRLSLVDFGIAKHFQVGSRGTQVGTEGYSPPEQYRGEATPQADIYALGATLHHLLTNRDPRLETPFSFTERPIRSVNPSLPPELEAVIDRALQYKPEDRYPDALTLRDALWMAARKTGTVQPDMVSGSSSSGSLAEAGQVKPLWVFQCEDEIRGAPICYRGAVYVGAYDNNLYALNASTGEFTWKHPTGGGVVTRPAVQETQVIFGSEDGQLYALSTRTGSKIWAYPTGGPVRSSPRIAEGHVFFGSDDGYLYAVNTNTARRAWRFDAGALIRSSPYVYQDTVTFGTEEGDFFCVDFGGGERWRYRAARAVTSSPVVSEDAVFFTSLDNSLYSLDAEKGWMLWRYRLGKPSISSPAAADRRVYAGSIDGHLYCLEAGSGREVWRFKTGNQVNGGAVVANGTVLFGSVDGSFYALDARTGKLRWMYETGGPITGSPAVFDGVVYFGSHDHKVYALLV